MFTHFSRHQRHEIPNRATREVEEGTGWYFFPSWQWCHVQACMAQAPTESDIAGSFSSSIHLPFGSAAGDAQRSFVLVCLEENDQTDEMDWNGVGPVRHATASRHSSVRSAKKRCDLTSLRNPPPDRGTTTVLQSNPTISKFRRDLRLSRFEPVTQSRPASRPSNFIHCAVMAMPWYLDYRACVRDNVPLAATTYHQPTELTGFLGYF